MRSIDNVLHRSAFLICQVKRTSSYYLYDQPYTFNFCYNDVTGRHHCQVLQCLSALRLLKMYKVGIPWRLVHALPPELHISCPEFAPKKRKKDLDACFTISMSSELYPGKSSRSMFYSVEGS